MTKTAPIGLNITCAKSQLATGEQIVIGIEHDVFEDLRMEMVALNVERTRITIDKLDETPPWRTLLDGSAHMQLYRVPFRSPISRVFDAPAGSRWSTNLRILDYSRPLPTGRYRISVRYRWGDTAREVVDAGAVEVTCTPQPARAVARRWLGGAAARSQLELLWVSDSTWYYAVAHGRDPSVLKICVDLRMDAVATDEAPRLAQLNAIPDAVFDRHAFWLRGSDLHRLRFSYVGRMDAPTHVALDVPPGAALTLAEPPMQRADVGCDVLVSWSDGAAAQGFLFVQTDREGLARQRPISYAGPPLHDLQVLWRIEPERLGVVFGLTADRKGVVAVDLESGEVRRTETETPLTLFRLDARAEPLLYGCLEKANRVVEVVSWPTDLSTMQVSARYDLAAAPTSARLVDVEDAGDRSDIAVLCAHDDGLFALRAGMLYRLPPLEAGAFGPWLASGPRVYAMAHEPNRGFTTMLVDNPPPEEPV